MSYYAPWCAWWLIDRHRSLWIELNGRTVCPVCHPPIRPCRLRHRWVQLGGQLVGRLL